MDLPRILICDMTSLPRQFLSLNRDIFKCFVLDAEDPVVKGPKNLLLGGTLKLSCETDSNPKPSKITWKKGDDSIANEGGIRT